MRLHQLWAAAAATLCILSTSEASFAQEGACEVGSNRCVGGVLEKCVGEEEPHWEMNQDCGWAGDECLEDDNGAQCATPQCTGFFVDFENLRRTSSYTYADQFFSGGLFFEVTEHIDAYATSYFSGQATVVRDGYASGVGQELALANAGIRPSLPPAQEIEFVYAETGHDIFLVINDVPKVVSHMTDLDGDIVGGVKVEVFPSSATQGSVKLSRVSRSIIDLRLAGHELSLDEMAGCATLPAIGCEPGATQCDGNALRRCGYSSNGDAGWFSEDCGVGGGRCFDAVDGARCLAPPSSASDHFADPMNYYFVKQNLKWQDVWQVYDRSSDSLKSAYSDWSDSSGVIPNKPDLHNAIDAAMAWLDDPNRLADLHGQAASILDLGGGSLGTYTSGTSHPLYYLDQATAWQLYVAWVAQAIALDMSGELPWTLHQVGGFGWTQQAALFDGAEMMFLAPSGDYGLAANAHPAFLGTAWGNYLGQTLIGMPRDTLRFLQQEDIVRATPEETVAALIEWIRPRLVHFYGSATRENMAMHWGVDHYPTVEMVAEGTIRSGDATPQHWTVGCHGTTAFMRHLLRALNIPARVLQTCYHAQLWVGDETPGDGGLFLDHGDNPYNSVFSPSVCTGDHLLLDESTYLSRFLHGHNHDDSATCGWIGHQATPASVSTCP